MMATQSAPHWGFCSLVLDAYVYQQEPANTPRKRLPRAELNARVLATILLLLSLYPLGFSKVHLQITKDRPLVSLGQKSPSTRVPGQLTLSLCSPGTALECRCAPDWGMLN